MSQPAGRVVAATYRVAEEQQPAFLDLLRECEKAMLEQGLITNRPFLRLRSAADPELLVEFFEWVDATAFERAAADPVIGGFWNRYAELWKAGGFGLDAFPESHEEWAQLVPYE